jgi:hypothetical protein
MRNLGLDDPRAALELFAAAEAADLDAAGSDPGGWWILTEISVAYEPHEYPTHDLTGWRRERLPSAILFIPHRLDTRKTGRAYLLRRAGRPIGQRGLAQVGVRRQPSVTSRASPAECHQPGVTGW